MFKTTCKDSTSPELTLMDLDLGSLKNPPTLCTAQDYFEISKVHNSTSTRITFSVLLKHSSCLLLHPKITFPFPPWSMCYITNHNLRPLFWTCPPFPSRIARKNEDCSSNRGGGGGGGRGINAH